MQVLFFSFKIAWMSVFYLHIRPIAIPLTNTILKSKTKITRKSNIFLLISFPPFLENVWKEML